MEITAKKVYIFILAFLIFVLLITTLVLTFIKLEDTRPDYRTYDMQILAIYWNPSTCLSKLSFSPYGTESQTCLTNVGNHTQKIFTIHGLWPSFKNQSRIIDFCYKDNDIEIISKPNDPLYKNMRKFWPGSFDIDTALWKHEYNKHGYCYNKRNKYKISNYDAYFNQTVKFYEEFNIINLYKNLDLKDEVLRDNANLFHFYQTTRSYISQKVIEKVRETTGIAAFNESNFGLYCLEVNDSSSKDNYQVLSEIRINLDVNNSLKLINLDMDKAEANNNCKENIIFPVMKEVYEKVDIFIYSVFWTLTSCRYLETQDNQTKTDICFDKINNIIFNNITIHGLWPSYSSGELPVWANPDNDIEIDNLSQDLEIKLNKSWPSYGDNKQFWKHEYNKHGYAYNQFKGYDKLNYEKYLKDTLELYEYYNFKDIVKDYLIETEKTSTPSANNYTINKNKFKNYIAEKFLKNNEATLAVYCYNISGSLFLSEIRLAMINTTDSLIPTKKDGYFSDEDCADQFFIEYKGEEEPIGENEEFIKEKVERGEIIE